MKAKRITVNPGGHCEHCQGLIKAKVEFCWLCKGYGRTLVLCSDCFINSIKILRGLAS
jgi:hypothetical protein